MIDFHAGKAFWNWREALAAAQERLTALHEAVGHVSVQPLAEMSRLYAIVLEYQPDLIIEVGRLSGNTTVVITEAAQQLENTPDVKSYCLTNVWQEATVPKLAALTDDAWFAPLDAQQINAFDVDMQAVFGDSERILFLWDAHGWAIAEYMLGVVLPLLREREHLMMIHDIFDTRYVFPGAKPYNGTGIWQGEAPPHDQMPLTRIFAGPVYGIYEEILAVLDFSTRNDLPMHSVEHEMRTFIEADEARMQEAVDLLGAVWTNFSTQWWWISLNEKAADVPLTFPTFTRPQPEVQTPKEKLADQIQRDLGRYTSTDKPSPLTYLLILAKVLTGRYARYYNE
jgi:hypothetical protein